MRRSAAAIGLTISMSGCTLLTEEGLVNVRGKFDSLSCSELVTRYDETSSRERELIEQMERAARDPLGPIVNTFVYSTPLAKERADLVRIRETAAQIDCDLLARSPDSVRFPSAR